MYPLIICIPENNFCNFTFKINSRIAEFHKDCDIYIGDNDLLFCCADFIQRFSSPQNFDTKDLKNLEINYNSDLREFNFKLPCLPLEDDNLLNNEKINDHNLYHADNLDIDDDDDDDNKELMKKSCNQETLLIDSFNIAKMQRITNSCVLIVNTELSNFTENFCYGFCGKIRRQNSSNIEEGLSKICRIENVSKTSPLSRTYQRTIDENKEFSSDQYKLDFVELQIPDGYENPVKFTHKFKDIILSKEDENLINSLNSETLNITDSQKSQIECELVSILLAICYDIRTTSNETTCESAWTRSILTPVLSYFEPIDNLRSALIAFFRRSLTYPLYRSYDLSRYCCNDVIDAFQNGKNWILKQLLINHKLFLTSYDDRTLLNIYYIEDFIRYITTVMTDDDFELLSKNLKNANMLITKKSIQLNLIEIEAELLKELIKDVHLPSSSSESYDIDGEDEYDFYKKHTSEKLAN